MLLTGLKKLKLRRFSMLLKREWKMTRITTYCLNASMNIGSRIPVLQCTDGSSITKADGADVLPRGYVNRHSMQPIRHWHLIPRWSYESHHT